ncbi:MAG: flippase [Gemmatimonadetes bacterium]|nr:flippase [Gemmatimonadota bacterium]
MFSRIKSLAQHTAVYGMGDLLGRAVSILLVPIYARHLTSADNGILSLAFAFIGFSAALYSLGLNPALIRLLSGKTDLGKHRAAFSSAFWALFATGIILSSLVWTNAGSLAHHLLGSSDYNAIFELIAAVVLLDALSEPLFTLCRARQRSFHYAIVRVIQHTLQLGLTAYFIAILGRGPIAVFEANLISSLFALIVMFPVGLRMIRPTFDVRALRDLLRFGFPFVPSAFSFLIISLSDRFLIRFFLDLDDLGIYGITYKLGLPIFFVVKAFRSAWAPAVLDETEEEDTRQMCARVTTYFTLFGIFGCLILATFAREIIVLIAGDNAPTYLEGIRVVPVVGLAFFFHGLYIILTAGVYAEGRAGSLPFIVGTGACVNIAINIFLLPKIGFIAAAYSTLIAHVLMTVLLFLIVRRFYPIPYEYGRLGKICVAGAVVFIVLSPHIHDTSIEGVIARVIFVAGYPLILWGWRFFTS